MFWNLSRSDYKFEVYKIVNEVSFYLKQAQISFIFEQIKLIPADKLAMEEFTCLSELGKYAKEDSFKEAVSAFFWQIICTSEAYKEELVTTCITRFCEMVKYWDISKKQVFFKQLTQNLKDRRSSLASIKLFKGLIKDQKERHVYSASSVTNYGYSYSIDTSSSPIPKGDNEQKGDDVPELTLSKVLEELIQ